MRYSKIGVFVFGWLACSAACGGDVMPLWPAGRMPDAQPQQIAAPTEISKRADFKPDAHRLPYLEWFAPPTAAVKKDACMIIISGGAYQCCCDGPAFRPLVRRLTEEGVTCVNLTYRTPRPAGLDIWQTAWEDGQRAVRLVRREAARRGFDPEKIGVLGCSAGSHLSLLLATSSQTSAYAPVDALDATPCHINWAITFCPAYVLTDGLTGPNASHGTGAGVRVSPCFKFDAKTCPVCSFHGSKDPYSPFGSTQVYRRLRRMKIPAELHLDADRGHGVGRPAAFERAIEFMRQMGYLGKLAREKHVDHRFHPDDTLRTEKEFLWPEGKTPDVATNQTYRPYLTWYVPETLKTKAIQIILPGGGYSFCNVINEGLPVAFYLNGKGMTAVVVKYRCPRAPGKPKHWSAWQDAQRAIRLVRAEAAGRGLDPDRIGLMGFSAGGHLTLQTAVNATQAAYAPVDARDALSCAVQWACPVYPAYALTDGVDTPNATGGNDDGAVPVSEFSFDALTPPMCFMHGDADGWAAMNSVKVWERLVQMGVHSDLHTFAKRGHCFQVVSAPGTGSYVWLDRVWDFLSRKGFNK